MEEIHLIIEAKNEDEIYVSNMKNYYRRKGSD